MGQRSVFLDFSKDLLQEETIVSSPVFDSLCADYLSLLAQENPSSYRVFCETFGENAPEKGLSSFYKRLLKDDFSSVRTEYLPLSRDKTFVLDSIDGLYDVWRKKERYGILSREKKPCTSAEFIDASERFAQLVLKTFRKAYENVLGGEQNVYRQLPSGLNAGFIVSKQKMESLPKDLSFLADTETIDSLLIRPPFICSSKDNTRKGTFFYQDLRLRKDRYDAKDYLCAAIRIKDKVGYVFVHKEYFSFLVALGNLFQIVSFDEIAGEKADFIVVFGADVDAKRTYYYQDEGVYVGLCPLNGDIAYFGYLKKIILTLYNLEMIEEKKLPIHGAGMEITLKNGKTYNLVLLGDSGAGKSETMEALKRIGSGEIVSIKTIFDDMGTFSYRDGQVVCSGTETGAFVRLDDLSQGYSLQSVDRAVYINIDRTNSRVVIPIETYEFSRSVHKVDIFLLADNFTKEESGVKRYTDQKKAEAEFIKGERVAKGTTSEKGKVSTFFANPFGPVQKEEETRPLIGKYFSTLFAEGVYVGRLYTKLALDPVNGPEIGAQGVLALLSALQKK